MSRATLDPARFGRLSCTGVSPFLPGLSSSFPLAFLLLSAVRTPGCSHPGLGSSAFARRYLRNRCYFLFLRLLRCFSSPGSLRMTMDSSYGAWAFPMRVSPFGDLRISAYVRLPEAFRSLSRPSSALSAKASALRPSLLNLCRRAFRSPSRTPCVHSRFRLVLGSPVPLPDTSVCPDGTCDFRLL